MKRFAAALTFVLVLPAIAALFIVGATARAQSTQSAFDAQQAAQAAQAAARAAQEANDIARRAAMQATLDSMNASRASRMQALQSLRSGSSGEGNGTTDATQRMIEQITKETPVRRAVPPPRVDVWTPAKRPCPHLRGEVLPALLANADACGIVGPSRHQQRVFFIIDPNAKGDLTTPEDYERDRQLAEAGKYLEKDRAPAGVIYTESSPDGIMRIIRQIDADLAAVNEKLNASQPDFSEVNRINDEIQKEAAKVAAGDNVGTALARMFTPAGTIRQPGAKLQALLLQQAIARDRAIRQHAAEHPELYAERSTP